MDEMDINGLNGAEETPRGVSEDAEIVPPSASAEPEQLDVFSDGEPVADLEEIWQAVRSAPSTDSFKAEAPAQSVAAAEEEGSRISALLGELNPLRRFAAGSGKQIAERMSSERREGLVRKALATKAGKAAVATSILAFAVWWGGEAKASADFEAATRWIRPDFVRADGFDVAGQLVAQIDTALSELAARGSREYRRGVEAARDLLMTRMLEGAEASPQVQAGLYAEIVELRAPEVRREIEEMIHRAKRGDEVTAEQMMNVFERLAAPADQLTASEIFERVEVRLRHRAGDRVRETMEIPVSRDARLARALIQSYAIEQLIHEHFGHDVAVRQLQRMIEAEAKNIEQNRQGIKGTTFGPSEAFPIMSRVRNGETLVPAGSRQFEQGAADALSRASERLQEAVLQPDVLSRRGPAKGQSR